MMEKQSRLKRFWKFTKYMVTLFPLWFMRKNLIAFTVSQWP